MQVAGKVFVVTGGGNGIGRAVVHELLRRGARVAAVDVDATGLDETAAATAGGERLSTHVLSVADRQRVLALPDAVVAAHGQVDGLLNIAGVVQQFVPVADLGFDEIERVLGVNFWGTVNTTKAFLPLLCTRPGAALVNVSSMGALVPVPGQSAYGASKAAVKLLTEGLHAELKDTSVCVTVVFPGAIDTHIVDNSGVTLDGVDADGTSMRMTSAQAAARVIVEAVERGTHRVRIGSDAKMLDRLGRLMPQGAIDLVAKKMKEIVGG